MLGKGGSKVGDAPLKCKYTEYLVQTLEIKTERALTVLFSTLDVRVL